MRLPGAMPGPISSHRLRQAPPPEISSSVWQHESMIVAGTYRGIWIDFGKDEPGMILRREYREDGYRVWRDYLIDGKPVTAPVDIGTLPKGKYRLV